MPPTVPPAPAGPAGWGLLLPLLCELPLSELLLCTAGVELKLDPPEAEPVPVELLDVDDGVEVELAAAVCAVAGFLAW